MDLNFLAVHLDSINSTQPVIADKKSMGDFMSSLNVTYGCVGGQTVLSCAIVVSFYHRLARAVITMPQSSTWTCDHAILHWILRLQDGSHIIATKAGADRPN